MKNFAIDIVQRPQFENSIIFLIILNAAILGLETVPTLVQRYGDWFELAHDLILAVFIIEAFLKITAVAPRLKLYFGDGCRRYPYFGHY